MVRNYRENYKNWKNLVNTPIPIGIIYGEINGHFDVWIKVHLIKTICNTYALECSSFDLSPTWRDYPNFPTTKDWNELVASFK